MNQQRYESANRTEHNTNLAVIKNERGKTKPTTY